LAPKQLTAIEEAGKIISKFHPFSVNRPRLYSVSSSITKEPGAKNFGHKKFYQSLFFPDPKEHGGSQDTSIALFLSEKSVKPSFRSLPERRLSSSKLRRFFNYWRNKTSGYWGNPSLASIQAGQKSFEQNSFEMSNHIKKVLRKEKFGSTFRSWYSVLPPNKSNFKVWILLLGLMGLLIAWLYMSMQMFG